MIVALVGKPNSGKTTLYNWLTRSNFKAVNYPGATVEIAEGRLHDRTGVHDDIKVLDTPGVYTLGDGITANSEDERVTAEILASTDPELSVDVIGLVVDATQMESQVSLVNSVLNLDRRVVVILTMSDLLKKLNQSIDLVKLSQLLGGVRVIQFDGILGGGLDEITSALKEISKSHGNTAVDSIALSKHDLKKVFSKPVDHLKSSVALDQWLLHPVLGYIVFFLVATSLFSLVYWVSEPFMGFIEDGFAFLITQTQALVPGLVGSFLSDGVLSALGGVVIFAPQIFILFLGIGLLESSGYLARVAILVNRPLEWIGLGGRSFVPLLSGFACAIPGLMATRNIPNKKEKILAQMMVPIMTCSARLPVFGLFIGFLFYQGSGLAAGLMMACLYFLSLIIGALAVAVINRIIEKNRSSFTGSHSQLALELPMYRRPLMKIIVRGAFEKLKAFIKRAGPVIFVLSLVLWIATTFPRPANQLLSPSSSITSQDSRADQVQTTSPNLEASNLQTEEGSVTESQIAQNSYAAQLGRWVEPVFYPMGVDWRVGFGLISAFAAREVFVSATALMFNIEAEDEDAQAEGLLGAMRTATFDHGPLSGRAIFTVASIAALIVFFIVALQCVSTFGVLKQESGSLKFASLYLVLSNVVAYILAVGVFQILRAFGL